MLQFQEERLAASAGCVTGMENCINQTIDYVRERKAFGAPLLNNQAIHFKLAELMTEVELLSALLYRATDKFIDGE